ncbi:hypothetical protein L7F22_046546 [Adiantum nelumboides]|nr:hypothetical protein [Adiantum nelumboides]
MSRSDGCQAMWQIHSISCGDNGDVASSQASGYGDRAHISSPSVGSIFRAQTSLLLLCDPSFQKLFFFLISAVCGLKRICDALLHFLDAQRKCEIVGLTCSPQEFQQRSAACRENSEYMSESMGDVELPQDLLSVLPIDPYEQLDVARKITSMAVSVRVSELESETDRLRQRLSEKESTIYDLQQHVAELEHSLREATEQLSQASVEQAKLLNEKDTLATNVKKLTRDVAKLETFKRTLMQSLQDDDEKDESDKAPNVSNFSSSAGSFNVRGTDIDSSTRISSLHSAAELATPSTLPDSENPYDSEAKSVSQKPSSTTPSRLTPQLTPTVSPRRSATGSPSQMSAPGSPRWQSTSDARLSVSSSQSTSQHTTAPNSPPPLQAGSAPPRTPRVDGKEFFRQARNRLSYEQFSSFLNIIKELNAHRQTKEETLRRAEEIFGSENQDLFVGFNGLLSRHLPA